MTANPYKQTTKHKIIGYLRRNGWTPIYKLEAEAPNWYTTAGTVGRRARELAEDGTLDRRVGKVVEYRLKEVSYQESRSEIYGRV